MLPAWARDDDASDDIPPPLISYSRYGLDLNTVSCSPSQPHYIALGGAHLHCFLHDRRMLAVTSIVSAVPDFPLQQVGMKTTMSF